MYNDCNSEESDEDQKKEQDENYGQISYKDTNGKEYTYKNNSRFNSYMD